MEKLNHATALEMAASIKVEAEANINSGDVSTNANARRMWIIGDILETFLNRIPANVFDNGDTATN